MTIAQSGIEERRGLVDRPYRSFRPRFTGMNVGETVRHLQAVGRTLLHRFLLPLAPDLVTLTAAAGSGALVLTVTSTSYRRFFVGARVLLHSWGSDRRPAKLEVLRIAALDETHVHLEAPTAFDQSVGARVIPLVDTDMALEHQQELVSDRIGDLQLELEEVTGPSALPPWIPNWDDPPLDTYRQIPILDLAFDWGAAVQVRLRRAGERQASGRASVTSPAGDGPRFGFSFDLAALNRPDAWRALRFIDSRMGRVRAFWMVSPVREYWTLTGLLTTYALIELRGVFDDIDRFFSAVALRYKDGKTQIREISLAELVDPTTVKLSFREPIPLGRADLEAVAAVAPAHLLRFDRDDYEERWLTDSILRVHLEAIEVVDRDAEIARYSDDLISAAPDTLDDLFLSLLPQIEMEKPDKTPATLDGDDVETWKDSRSGVTRKLETLIPPAAAYHQLITAGVGGLRFRNSDGAMPETIGSMDLGSDEALWSNALGMTVFIVLQGKAGLVRSEANDYIMRIPNALDTDTDVFDWTATRVRLFEDAGVPNQDLWIDTADILYPRSQPHIVALVWKPGAYARVYRDGRPMGEAPRAVVDLPTSPARMRFFRMANDNLDTLSSDDALCSGLFVFRRALPPDELNAIGKWLETYAAGVTWERVI